MVRGNWQKRVEQAENRRKEAKQKKVIKSSKAVNKGLVQNHLWPLLNKIAIPRTIYDSDDHDDPGGGNGNNCDFIIHIWVDTPPSSTKDSYHCDDEDDEDESIKRSPKQKKSKREYNPKHSSKKVHPRSHENHLSSPEGKSSKRKNSIDDYGENNNEQHTLHLCKSSFFHGCCKFSNNKSKSNSKSSSKKSSSSSSSSSHSSKHCDLFKYSKKLKQKTLFDVMMDSKKNTNQSCQDDDKNREILNKCADAASSAYLQSKGMEETDDKKEENTVPMVYYYQVDLRSQIQQIKGHQKSDNKNNNEEIPISDLVSNSLSSEQCPVGSCVYAVYKKTLLFDRFRGGVIINMDDHQDLFMDEGQKLRSSSISLPHLETTNNENNTGDYIDLKLLPVTVLEHILSFSDDEASGIFSQVCKAWNEDVGKRSPALWLNLIQRRNWPIPSLPEEQYGEEEDVDSLHIIEETKKMFLQHKSITQAVDVMVDGIEYFISNSSDPPMRRTLAIHKVRDNKDNTSSSSPTACCDIHVWNDTTMILAHKKECTLTLYKAERNDDTKNSLSCKQIVGIRVAPFPHSKRTACELQSFDLDNDSILCCYEVNKLCNWLILLKRDELLLNSAESVLDNNVIRRFDLVKLLQHSCDSRGMFGISEFFEMMEIEFEYIEVSIHNKIVSCGDGYFVFLMNILMPSDEDHGEEVPLDFVARAVVQFSVRDERLTWGMIIPPELSPDHISTLLSNYNPVSRTIVCSALVTDPMLTLHIDKGGVVIDTLHEDLLCMPPKGRWEHPESYERKSVVSSTHTIFADKLHRGEGQSIITLSFVNLEDESDEELISYLNLDHIDNVLSLHIHERYCIVLGSKESGDFDFDAHWFGDEREEGQVRKPFVITIVHIPSKKCIFIRSLDQSSSSSFPNTMLTFGGENSPYVFGVTGNKSVALSGSNLRDMEVCTSEKSNKNNKSKVKKKKKIAKNNKKDGFARGMSLRG